MLSWPGLRGKGIAMRFDAILRRAEARKGGPEGLASLLPDVPGNAALKALPDDRVLAVMARVVFNSGFNWRVISAKWDGFEEAFFGFDIDHLLHAPEELAASLSSDTRIVRHGKKIQSVFDNARFIRDTVRAHESFGAFLADWPSSDQVGLMEHLKKQGSRLGGNTGQYFLRFIGWDGFITSRDVIAGLKHHAGLDIADSPTSKRDLKAIQEQFNAWHEETKMPYAHLSRTLSMSVGADAAHSEIEAAIKRGDIPQI